jgi:hypothetical protein
MKTTTSCASGDIITKAELAAELRCSMRQIERLQKARRIPSLKLSGRMIRYNRRSVMIALSRFERAVA